MLVWLIGVAVFVLLWGALWRSARKRPTEPSGVSRCADHLLAFLGTTHRSTSQVCTKFPFGFRRYRLRSS